MPTCHSPGQIESLRLQRVLVHIAQNLNRSLSVAELAAIACLSPSHFIRYFRRKVGRPPYQYLRLMRLEYAKSLLKQSDSSVVQISLECGFSSQANFTRAFCKQFGTSPVVYRARTGNPHIPVTSLECQSKSIL